MREGKPIEDNRKIAEAGQPGIDTQSIDNLEADRIIIDKCYLLKELLIAENATTPQVGFEQQWVSVFNEAEIVILKQKLLNLVDKL